MKPGTEVMSGVNDFVCKFATVNGSGSASANTMFAKTIFRMGVPVSPKNIFPSNNSMYFFTIFNPRPVPWIYPTFGALKNF